ncbi:hypothetical protein CLV28_0368 [Sediminihabitans luteus]|uniref:Uncharacterized protein n=1 Tax=Sediminihabitans luteus TaxID=1138585 RepID=A0A2M9CYZ0_9CELL|nr:DUF6350 family protein [Sediminihabitans luteus]PJJ77154.1 hypothetical protein CLV28_0368 [Sediminihabitans luteus]GII98602.1 hypothetical protein Slu03_09800 [Sediminihabitans luteus]
MSAPTRPTTTARRTPPRTVPGEPLARPEGRLAELRSAAAGAFAALQALGLSLAIVVLPAIVAGLAVADSGEDSWGGAVHVALGIWLLGHGVPWAAGPVVVTLAPLGITLLALFCCYVAAKRTAHATLGSWGAATGVYAVAAFLLAMLAREAPGWWVLVALVGGGAVGGLGFALGILARPTSPRLADVAPWWLVRATDHGVGVGLRGAALATSSLVALAGVLVVCWAVAGRATSADVADALSPGVVGGIVLAISQLALVPNLVVWGVAWLAGPGFAVGSGTTFAPTEQVLGPVPALPLLGALPGDGWVGGPWAAAPLAVVLCGALAGVLVWRRASDVAGEVPPWRDLATGVGTAALGSGLVLAVLLLLGSGAVGPGTMAQVGAAPLLVGGVVAGEVALGAALVVGTLGARAAWRTRGERADRRWHAVDEDSSHASTS